MSHSRRTMCETQKYNLEFRDLSQTLDFAKYFGEQLFAKSILEKALHRVTRLP